MYSNRFYPHCFVILLYSVLGSIIEKRNDAEIDCEFTFDTESMQNFEPCTFRGFTPWEFQQSSVPACPNGTIPREAITPIDRDGGLNCLSYKYDFQLSERSEIVINYFLQYDSDLLWCCIPYPGLKNYLQGDFSYFYTAFENNDTFEMEGNKTIINTPSSNWQTVTIRHKENTPYITKGKLVVVASMFDGTLYIDKIVAKNVMGDCKKSISKTTKTDTPKCFDFENDEVDERQLADPNSCSYDFKDGKMTGLESCIEDWIDFGTKVILVPSCDTSIYVLTPKQMSSDSNTQTNKPLLLTKETEFILRFWYENFQEELRNLKISLVNDSYSSTDYDAEREIIHTWVIEPESRKWQTARFKIGAVVSTEREMKVLLDLGTRPMAQIYVDYLQITNVRNPEACYEEKPKQELRCR